MKNLLMLLFISLCGSIYLNAQPVASFEVDNNEGCSPLLVTFDASSSIGDIVYYEWDLIGYGQFEGAEMTTFTTSCIALYNAGPRYIDVRLTVTDIDGITDSYLATNVITVYPSTGGHNYNVTLCAGESVIVNGTTYNNETNPIGNEAFTNIYGCDSTVFVQVSLAETFEVANEVITHVPCTETQGGTINFDLACGTPPYAYAWTPAIPGAEDELTDLTSGIYMVTVTDANNDIATKSFEVLEPGGIGIIVGEITHAYCVDFQEGSVSFELTGGLAPYRMIENGITQGGFFTDMSLTWGLAIGAYELAIIDANGCVEYFPDPITIEEATEPFDLISVFPVHDTICYGDSITIGADAPGTVSFDWSNGVSCGNCDSIVVQPTSSTDYFVTVTNSVGCSITHDSAIHVIVLDCDPVWPGDTDTSKLVDNFDLLNIGLAYDEIGPERVDQSIDWYDHFSFPWDLSNPDGSNYKHSDTDGNGVINSDDTLAIVENWGEIHNLTGNPPNQFISYYPPSTGAGEMIPFYVEPDTLEESVTYALPVILGEDGLLAEDIYGIAFSLEYDPTVVVPGSAYLDFSNSWIGDINQDMIAIQKDFPDVGRIDIGLTRIDHTDIDGFGQMAEFYITIEDDILLRPNGGEDEARSTDDLEVVFKITNVLLLNSDGEVLDVNPSATTSIIQDISTSTINLALNSQVEIYPNPASDELLISTKDLSIEKLEMFSSQGQLLFSKNINQDEYQMSVEGFNDGVYFFKVQTKEGIAIKKVMVIR